MSKKNPDEKVARGVSIGIVVILMVGAALLGSGITLTLVSSRAPEPEAVSSFSQEPITGIVNAHEHIQSRKEVPGLLKAMEMVGVEKTVLVGSSWFTITLRGGFVRHDENNQEILEIAKLYPDKFIPFVTMDPEDPEKLEKLKKYVEAGACGLKLYSGHGGKTQVQPFHPLPLDDPGMMEVYAYCQSVNIPILLHINFWEFGEEFERVLNAFPELIIIGPHYCLSSNSDSRIKNLKRLLDTYPNLYTDLSFGSENIQIQGMRNLSKAPRRYRDFYYEYGDRVLYGTDLVVTNHPKKTVAYMAQVMQAYRDFLEKDKYRLFLIPEEELNGIYLDRKTLRKVYSENFERIMSEVPNYRKQMELAG